MIPTQNAAPWLTLTLFGPMQALVQGQLLPSLHSRKGLWLLALLALRHDRSVQREWLAATLWPDSDQNQAFTNLRKILSELRGRLGDQSQRLQTPSRHTLQLDLTGADVDVIAFDAAIKSQKRSDLEEAVALYRGPLLEGCTEEWVFQERTVREHQCLQALEKLGDALLSEGEYAQAVGYYQRAVGIDPWWEGARRGWMEALAKSGDTNAALQVYREFVEVLKSDPKAVPDEQTSALYQRLRSEARKQAVTHAVVTTQAAPVPRVQGYLPHPLTDLVGREDERMEVALLLQRSRLVTLTGMGGIGKTRLAREVAGEVVGEYADGVWLVSLEALIEGRLVIQQIASVLGLKEEPARTPLLSVTDHLRQKRLLLVLDNCEHLREASAQVVAHLLRECREVRILATSREALGIVGETVWTVPALTVPDPAHLPQTRATLLRVLIGYESVQLFVERAQSVQKSFLLAESNARRVAEVCFRLEGIPLAIELAAARVKAMSVEQIAFRLEDYLGLLTVGSRTAQSRQQTLRATLDWSYALLSEAECSLLRRLSVFAGGCLLEAAEFVCADQGRERESGRPGEGEQGREATNPESRTPIPGWDPRTPNPYELLDLLTSLVDKSLVVFEERGPAEGRYRLSEMVRQYAGESLQASGEAEQVKTRHRDWFLALAEAAEPQLSGTDQAIWLRRLETEHDNLRAALAWSETQAQEVEAGLRLAGALLNFWETRGHYSEGRACLSEALGRDGAVGRTRGRAKALNAAGVLASCQGDYGAARELHAQSLTMQRELGDRRGIAYSLHNLGNVAHGQGDYDAAGMLYEQSLAMQRELADKGGMAYALNNLGNVAYDQGDYDAARTLYEQSLALKWDLGDRRGIAFSLHNLGNVAHGQGDYGAARGLHEQSLAIRRELGDRRGIAHSLHNLGIVAYSQGDYDTVRRLLKESLALKRDLGDHTIASTLEDLAKLGLAVTEPLHAARLWGAAQRLREEKGSPLEQRSKPEYEQQVAATRAAVGNAATFDAAWSEGRAMTPEQAISYALESESV